jgi:hypothetical protein
MPVLSNTAFTSWLQLYQSASDVPELNATESVDEIFTNGNSRDTDIVITSLLDFPFSGTYLAYAMPVSCDIGVECLHHFFKQSPPGVSFEGAKEKVYAISGLKEGDHKVVEFNPIYASTSRDQDLCVDTPPLSDFMALGAGTKKFGGCQASDDPDVCRVAFTFPRVTGGGVPPFLIPSLHDADPTNSLINVARAIHAYATENLTAEARPALWDGAYKLLQRLWTISQDDYDELKDYVLPGGPLEQTTNTWALDKGASIVKMYLKGQTYLPRDDADGSETSRQNPSSRSEMHSIASALSSVAENNAKMASIFHDKLANSDETSWTNRIMPTVQSTILRASADLVTHDAPDSPTEEYLAFLKSKEKQTLGQLTHALIAQRHSTQVIDRAFAKALWMGTLYNAGNSDTPMGLSIFLQVPFVVGEGEEKMSQEEQSLRLENKLLSDKEIKAMASTTPKLPKDANDFQETLKNLLHLLAFLFNETSYIYWQVRALLLAIEKHKFSFVAVTTGNHDYIASLMQTVDTKISQYLSSCANATEDIDFDILDFADEIKCIRTRKSIGAALSPPIQRLLAQSTKPQVAQAEAVARKRPSNNAADDPETKPKRKKGGNTAAVNTSPIDEDWIKLDEPFGIFNNHMATAPKFQGASVCVKYHVRGLCSFGDKCQRKHSHTNAFDNKAKADLDAWVKMCRKSAANK